MVDVPKEVNDRILQLVEEIKSSGKLRLGTNETTKSVERGEAKLVVTATDINPKEIVMHLPLLCEEKNIPYVEAGTKAELGAAAGLPVGTSAVAVANAGEAAKKLAAMAEQLNTLTKKDSKPAPVEKKEAPADKPAPKKEKPAEPSKENKPKPEPAKEEPKPEEKKEAVAVTA